MPHASDCESIVVIKLTQHKFHYTTIIRTVPVQKEDDKGDQLLQDAERGSSKAMIPKLKIRFEGRVRGKESEIIQIIRESLIDHVSIEHSSKNPDVGVVFYDVPGRLSTNIIIAQLKEIKGNDMAVSLEIKPQISI